MKNVTINIGNGTKVVAIIGVFVWAAVKIAAIVKELVGYKKLTKWVDDYTEKTIRRLEDLS